jgi:hypothetical protein
VRPVAEVTYDGAKFKELVLYLAEQSTEDDGFGMVKLNKLLYLADFEAYRLLGRPITGATYERQEFGPVARSLPLALDELAARGYVTWQLVPSGPHTRKVPTAAERPDTSLFSEAEMGIINAALGSLRDLGGRTASEWSHKESVGWNEVEDGQEIPYHSAVFSAAPIPQEDVERARHLALERGWAAIGT